MERFSIASLGSQTIFLKIVWFWSILYIHTKLNMNRSRTNKASVIWNC